MRHVLTVVLLIVAGRALAAEPLVDLSKATWQVRDVAADSDYSDGAPLHLHLDSTSETDPTWSSHCSVTDTTAGERAITLALIIPLEGDGWTWHDDPETSRRVTPSTRPFINATRTKAGADGQASLYPLAVLSRGDRAFVLAVPLEPARIVRFLYDARRGQLRAEFDFGLSPIPERFPSRADARVIAYEVPGKWAFRQALANYYALHGAAFARRAGTKGGVWLPFGDMRPIDHPEDFGFACHECSDAQLNAADVKSFVDADHNAGAKTYPYVEPPTYWHDYKGDKKAGYEPRFKQLQDDAANGDAMARATLVSGVEAADGRYDLYLQPVAYTNLAPWGSDANPDIPRNEKGWLSKGQYEFQRLSKLQDRADGVYVDSMEGWGELINYRKEHWKYTRFPLSFDPATKRVGLWNFWGTYSFVSDMSRALHEQNKLLMGNDAYFRYWFLAPHVDLPGREYTWIEKGKFTPTPDERYLFFRSMSYKRPYMMLMNNAFEDARFMEAYFQRSLFYAVFPSMFQAHAAMGETPYFANPDWYNRDRPLFKKYIPMIRKLDDAGWEPVPYATAEPATIRLERYGSWNDRNLAFTLHNTSDAEQDVTLTLDGNLHLPEHVAATEWIHSLPLSIAGSSIHLKLPPSGYAVIGLNN